MKNIPWKWIGIGVAVLAALVAVKFLPVAEWLKHFNEWIKSLGPLGFFLYIGVYAIATVLFLPGWIFTVGAGIAFGLLWGTVAAICGATIGATLAFLISRYAARDAVSKRFAKNKSSNRSMARSANRDGRWWDSCGLVR